MVWLCKETTAAASLPFLYIFLTLSSPRREFVDCWVPCSILHTQPCTAAMKTSLTVSLSALLLGANAITLLKRTDGSAPRVVEHTIQRRTLASPLQHDRNRMRKRANTISVGLDNEETLYFMNATIGTPAQSFRLHIDTGSSDTWVNVANSRLCSARGNYCSESGVYSPNSSSTYQYVNSEFNSE